MTRRIALDIELTLPRSESQPAERLAARAVLEATGFERRVARAWGNADGAPVEPVWLHIDIDGAAAPLPPDAWTDQDAIAARLDSRNCIDRIVLKDPSAPAGGRTATPPWCRQALFYDHEGRVRCFACDGIKHALADGSRRPSRTSPLAQCPSCDRKR